MTDKVYIIDISVLTPEKHMSHLYEYYKTKESAVNQLQFMFKFWGGSADVESLEWESETEFRFRLNGYAYWYEFQTANLH